MNSKRKSKWTRDNVTRRLKQLHKELGRRPVKRDYAGLYSATKSLFGTWNNAMEIAGFKVKRFQKPKIPDKLTPELSYFIGLLITDGHLADNPKRGVHTSMLFTSYDEELSVILRLIKDLFGYKPTIRKRKYGFNKRVNYQININSKNLASYFKDDIGVPSGNKSKIVRIPKVIFRTNKKNIINFVRGVIDGDGNISPKRPIRIASGSIDFLRDLKKLFIKLDLQSSEIKFDRTAYILYLYQKDNLKIYNLLYKSAKYYYPRKKRALEIQYI